MIARGGKLGLALSAAMLLGAIGAPSFAQRNAPPAAIGAGADWPGHGGSADESGFSTLTEIDTRTIGRLGPGLFRITLWVPGRQDAVDTPFQVVAV